MGRTGDNTAAELDGIVVNRFLPVRRDETDELVDPLASDFLLLPLFSILLLFSFSSTRFLLMPLKSDREEEEYAEVPIVDTDAIEFLLLLDLVVDEPNERKLVTDADKSLVSLNILSSSSLLLFNRGAVARGMLE